MAQVFPFRALRYNPALVRFERVLTQPYDKISDAMQDQYYAADPRNLIIVEKGRRRVGDTAESNVYTRAAAALSDWMSGGVLLQDPAPSFYVYSQEYTRPGTDERQIRRGFIGAGRLEPYSAGVVFRHEQTLSGPKADRLELLRHTQTETGQLFMLYADPRRRVEEILSEAESAPPHTELRDEYGVIHRLWIASDSRAISEIQLAMADERLVIADGHHRYETALAYRDLCRARASKTDPDAAFERVMMTFINASSEGLTILATHRVAAHLRDFSWPALRRHLEPWFAAEEFPFSDEATKAEARRRFLSCLPGARPRRGIGAYPAADSPGRAFYLLTLRDGTNLARLLPQVSPLERELDVVLLHQGILEPALGITPQGLRAEAHLSYEREPSAALDAVDSGRAQICFLLNPCEVGQVMKIATAGEVLPQKSTDFYPKLLSGITMYQVPAP